MPTDEHDGASEVGDVISCRFDPHTENVAAARHFVVDHAHLAGRSADDAALVASELAANAVLHAATPFEISLSAVGDLLRIAVADDDPALPTPDPTGLLAPLAVSGRGLAIVSQLAERLGADPTTTGKAVWAELRIRPGDQLGPLG
jgi:anti-sigma regulatory factor (Ser/Thr protein kinase)